MGSYQIIFYQSGTLQRGVKIMLGCSQDITVWLRKKVSESDKSKKEIFIRRIIPVKCRWKNYTERSTNNGAANIYNKTVIIIPYFESEPGFGIFDIKEGDIAALGIYDTDITGTSPYTLSEVRQAVSPNITTINSVAYNFDLDLEGDHEGRPYGNNGMKGRHLRLTGN